MNARTKTGLEILYVAVILGVLGDVLLRATPWGLNVTLFNIAFAAGVIFLLKRHAPERLNAQAYSLIGALLFFASMFSWRDAIELRVADTFAIIAILGILFLPTLKVSAKLAGLFQYAVGFVWAGVNSLFAAAALFGVDVRWNDMKVGGWQKHLLSVAKGVMIAAPLVIIFGALFMAADAVYEGWIKSVFNIDFANVMSHGMLFALFAWLTAGYFRGVVFAGATLPIEDVVVETDAAAADESRVDRVAAESGEYPVTLGDRTVVEHLNISEAPNVETTDEAKTDDEPKKWSWAAIDNSIVPGFTLGAVEVGVILGLMDLLFLSFVIVQVPYLFGGMDLVQNTPDFKLAEYARRGFGELVAVAGLLLPILLLGHWLIRKESRTAATLFRVLAGVQIALLVVIMASAVQRLVLLTGNLGYGMTTVRLYPLIFMTWLAVVFVWFAATVLRGARQHFAWGALWAAFLVLGATHVLNPDKFIVQTNIALMREGRNFDPIYNSELSDDALPTLLMAFPELNDEDAQMMVKRLARRHCAKLEEGGLRSLNISRYTASGLLQANSGFVDLLGGCESPSLNPYAFTDHH